MIEKLIEIIKYHSESVHVDFKSYEYSLGKHAKKNEFLKDVSGMANHPSNEPKYILIGIEEKNGMASEFNDISTLTDQANYQQFVEENIEPKINFEYKSFEYEGFKLAAFIISNNEERPYLFRKNVKKTGDRTQEFRIGDGFIRTGTSTRKLTRKDFEEIYTKRLESKDRKSDLIITPIYKKNSHWNYFMIDFSIENLSSKSIGFDAELRLFHGQGVSLKKRFDVEEGNIKDGLSSIYPQYFEPKIDSTILDLEIVKQNDYFKASRLKRINEDYPVKIPQKDSIENVFFEEILVGNDTNEYGLDIISLELILRSDDFKEGPLKKVYKINLKNSA